VFALPGRATAILQCACQRGRARWRIDAPLPCESRTRSSASGLWRHARALRRSAGDRANGCVSRVGGRVVHQRPGAAGGRWRSALARMSVAMNWDASYEATPPPWDIGHPQPALADLFAVGAVRGRVLDAGCGTGEHALLAAARGFEATGVDVSPRAIEMAREKSSARKLPARFMVHSALELQTLGEQFDTVLDCGL